MLSESFFSTVLYEKVIAGSIGQDRSHDKRSSLRCPHSNDHRAEERRSLRRGACVPREESPHHDWSLVVSPSQAMAIPSREAASCCSMDLYTSWSSRYASIYKNYPDLHIGGDHILNKKDSGCILECDDGPVLVSVDIDSSSPPTDLQEEAQEEGVLHSEDSNILPAAPFSNSALNGFLERKMQELYKQCLEETLGSPNVLMVNINQMSLLVSQEQNMDQAKAKEAILQYLCSATSGGSSEFITPILHISMQDNKKKWSTLSKKFRP
ncbi:TLR adapter interacting with SLC15A4 on the lysosome-like [Mantella aurantiaca]